MIRLFMLPLMAVPAARADYLEETGWRALAAALGPDMPDGAGVGVSQVEFGLPDYLPLAGSGTFTGTGALFAGKTFMAKSGPSGASGHASDVGAHIYSFNTNPSAGRATFTPGVSQIDCWLVDSPASAQSWSGRGWLKPGLLEPPLIEVRDVQNHSWISVGSAATAADDNDALRRLDFAVRRDGFLPVTGVNNGASAVPALMASAYNNLAVGLSGGGHSSGGVPSWLDGPGRQKPELVAPLDYTSFATGLVSSAAVLLRQTASSQGQNARLPETLKAVLLAGATKEEFPGWTRTPAAPLDPVYGAGELHIGNSWRILSGGEQAAGQSTARPDFAWGYTGAGTGADREFRLVIPPGFAGQSLSAAAVWNRRVRDSIPGMGYAASPDPLTDYQLYLERLPAAGGAVTVQESVSAIENLEHLWSVNLPSGTYRIRLAYAGGTSSVQAAVAWRLTRVPHRPSVIPGRSGNTDVLMFSGLIPGQAYMIQHSASLEVWEEESSFTATTGNFSWTVTPSAGRRFYRLAATGS